MNGNARLFIASAFSLGFFFVGIKYAPEVGKYFTKPKNVQECESYVDTNLLPKRCSRFVMMRGWHIEENYQVAYAVADAYAEKHPSDRWSIALNSYKAELKRLNKVNDQTEKLAETYEKGAYVLNQMTERDKQNALYGLNQAYAVFLTSRQFEAPY